MLLTQDHKSSEGQKHKKNEVNIQIKTRIIHYLASKINVKILAEFQEINLDLGSNCYNVG